MGDVAHHGDEGVVAVSGQGDDLGAEARHHRGHRGEHRRRWWTAVGRQHPDGALEHARGRRRRGPPARSRPSGGRRGSGGRRWRPTTGPLTLPTSVTRPVVAASASLDGIGHGQHRRGHERDLGLGVERLVSSIAPRRSGLAEPGRVGVVAAAPASHGPRRARPMLPPMRPRPMTLARRSSGSSAIGVTPGRPGRGAAPWPLPGTRAAGRPCARVGLDVEQDPDAARQRAVDLHLLGAEDGDVGRPKARAAVAGWYERRSRGARDDEADDVVVGEPVALEQLVQQGLHPLVDLGGRVVVDVVAPRSARTGTMGQRSGGARAPEGARWRRDSVASCSPVPRAACSAPSSRSS